MRAAGKPNLAYAAAAPMAAAEGVVRTYVCQVCQIDCGSESRLQQHRSGRKHRAKAAAIASSGGVGGGAASGGQGGGQAELEPEPEPEPETEPAAADPELGAAELDAALGAAAPAVAAALSPLVSERRLQSFRTAAAQRCCGVHLAFENLFQNDNCAYALRTAECAGIHHVHLIRGPLSLQSKRGGSLKRVDHTMSKSAERWLRVHYHADTAAFVRWAREGGFALFGAHADPSANPVADCGFAPGSAGSGSVVVFGNERDGMSAALREACDGLFFLPSVGLTQSYNVAAACAMTVHSLQLKGRVAPDCSDERQQQILAAWLLGSVPKARAREALEGQVDAKALEVLLAEPAPAPFEVKRRADD